MLVLQRRCKCARPSLHITSVYGIRVGGWHQLNCTSCGREWDEVVFEPPLPDHEPMIRGVRREPHPTASPAPRPADDAG